MNRLALAGWLAVCCSLTNTSEAAQPPNIVIIMSDDMGFSDLGCYGGEIQTPNLDRLATGGVRFTQFYNTARCCPTRASLLTGLYPHQAGMGHMVQDSGFDSYRGELSDRCVTIAEALRPAGYGAYAVGKWHVTKDSVGKGDKHNWPLQRGFDRFYGTITGAGSFFDPGTLTRDNTPISPFADAEYKPAHYYYTDAISDQAARFVREHEKNEQAKPLFLYVAYTAAHWPMHALEEDIAKYRGKYDAGYDVIRRQRHQRAQQLGLIQSSWPMAPTVGNWDAVKNKEWEARCMEVYAAMVDRMDQGIGRIVAALDETGRFENTLVFFLQDNGACAELTGRMPDAKRPEQPTLPAIAADVVRPESRPSQTREGFPVLTGKLVMPGGSDTYIAYGEGWANVSNTPFRLYKHWVHEGGISTPLIAHWPIGIAASRRNQLENQPGHLVDLMATCVDVAGAKYPTDRNGKDVKPRAGVSLRPAFAAEPLKRMEPIFWEHEGNRAVRDGRWKLVARHKSPWELYDMESDRTESNDLRAMHPAIVSKMTAQYEAWAEKSGVHPWPVANKGDVPKQAGKTNKQAAEDEK